MGDEFQGFGARLFREMAARLTARPGHEGHGQDCAECIGDAQLIKAARVESSRYDRMVKMLRQLEWAGATAGDGGLAACPRCGAELDFTAPKSDHRPGCTLNALLEEVGR
jgi:hypothetical protein